MSVSVLSYRKACLSSLLHDLRVVHHCLRYHVKNSFNPYSLKVSEELESLSDEVLRLFLKCSSESFSHLELDED